MAKISVERRGDRFLAYTKSQAAYGATEAEAVRKVRAALSGEGKRAAAIMRESARRVPRPTSQRCPVSGCSGPDTPTHRKTAKHRNWVAWANRNR